MSFRVRLALATSAAVTAAILIGSGAGYVLVRSELRAQVDRGLRDRAAVLGLLPPRAGSDGGPARPPRGGEPLFGGPAGFAQLVTAAGAVGAPGTAVSPLPITDKTKAVAGGTARAFLADARVTDTHVRILTTPYRPGVALQLARPLTEVDATLRHLRVIGLLATIAGVALAAIAGLVVARTAAAPVRRLTNAAEEIARTGDPGRRVGIVGDDEIGRLGTTFDSMLAALDDALLSQRRLVTDASHELRTPLTSVRMNVELLARDDLPDDERQQAQRDVETQLVELSLLVEDLVDVARENATVHVFQEVRLDILAAQAVERTRRHAPALTFLETLAPTIVQGVPERIERALVNLLENAARWSPVGGEVEVVVENGGFTVRDHGPGIDADDLTRIFDRFYRAPAARQHPGSGLGLAIVQRVAEEHGASASAENASGGGARFSLRFSPTS